MGGRPTGPIRAAPFSNRVAAYVAAAAGSRSSHTLNTAAGPHRLRVPCRIRPGSATSSSSRSATAVRSSGHGLTPRARTQRRDDRARPLRLLPRHRHQRRSGPHDHTDLDPLSGVGFRVIRQEQLIRSDDHMSEGIWRIT